MSAGRKGVLVALALGALAVAWVAFARSARDAESAAVAPEHARREVAPTLREAGVPLAADGDEAEEPDEADIGEPRAPLAAAKARPQADELEKATWVEGRVAFPPGTPADERAFVVARGRRFSDGAFDRAEVGADGGFRVAFAPKTKHGSLVLEARYLYLAEPLRLSPRRVDALVELQPELGGCVRGRVRGVGALVGREAELAGQTVRVTVPGSADDAVRSHSHGSSGASRETVIGKDLSFEVGGVPASDQATLGIDPARALAVDLRLGTIESGRAATVEVEIRPGARVRGRVVDESGRAIVGASVFCSTAAERAGKTRNAEADDAGAFDLAGLPDGKLRARARAEGYLDADESLGEVRDGDVRELELVLARGSAVAGRVLGTDGLPAEGAEVSLLQIDGDRYGSRVARVDGEGRFEISGLRASDGPFRALASLSDPEATSEGTSARRASDASRAPRRVGWVDGVRPGASGVEIALLESVALAGRVVDDRGEALRMFRVEARSVAALGAERPRDVIARDSFLSPDGRFVLDGLHAGRWDVVASALGHVSPVGRRVDVPADPAFELRLVRRAHLSGVVVDARGRPIAGAKVTLASLPQGPSLAPDSDAATSAADGRFLLETAPGAVTVRATVQGLAPSPDLELDVAAGERRSDLLLHVPDGGRIVGYVLDGDGNPADGWRVVVADENGRSAGSARTNGDGSFLLGPLVARTYTVRLASRNATRPVARDRVEARVVEGGTVEVRLGGRSEGATRVHGIVRCGGAPIARMTVTAWSDDDLSGRAATETDDGGRYELELLPGAHRLSVYGRRGDDGHVSLTLSVEVEGGTELRRDVDLPSGAISGRVLDDDGSPLENVALSVEEEHGATPFQASGNAAPDGTFSLECLPAGTYRLSVDGWRARRRAWIFRGGIVVGEGTRVEGLELRARPSCAVDGIVRDPAGGPLLGVEVFARGEDGELGPSPARCDAAGRFSVRDLPPGRTTFFARDASRASVEGSAIELTPDRRGDVELVLGPGTALDVEVAEADTSKCFVRVFDATGREVAREGSDKRPIAVLPPGTYRIVGTDDRGASAEASASLGGQAQSTVSLSFER